MCSLEEFVEMIQNAGLQNETFGTREIGIHFFLAIQTQVDEITSDRHMQMNFIEFIEGIARVAERLGLKVDVRMRNTINA